MNRYISINFEEPLVRRLENIATKTGMSLDVCALQAIYEYIENWEDFYNSEMLNPEEDEERFFLTAI
ncbi:MAG: ribbon-helix-helix protein, CopG family [Alphaproteobacteria bacterium]